ncbi:Ethylene-responsive transcription factor [Frankliniella fusca]|uniref:Regulatory protein zeste n=1 Tax=Frankliniella fusca TaxID=407009 RepID=A0AAE1LFM5_9NEOP|nr:Ethylene-responsive transcription factor [Frankliniella fusca]
MLHYYSKVATEQRRKKPRKEALKSRMISGEYLIDFMVAHPDFAAGRLSGVQGLQGQRALWERVTREGNSKGPAKETEQWQKAWTDMKTRIRSKALALKAARHQTGNKPLNIPTLTEYDKQVLGLMGQAATEGLSVPTALPEDEASLQRLRRGDPAVDQTPTPAETIFQILDLPVINPQDMTVDCEVLGSDIVQRLTGSVSGTMTAPDEALQIIGGDGEGLEEMQGREVVQDRNEQRQASEVGDDQLGEERARTINAKRHTAQAELQKGPAAKRQKDDLRTTVIRLTEQQNTANEVTYKIADVQLLQARNEEKRLILEEQKLELKRRSVEERKRLADAMTRVAVALENRNEQFI